MKKQNEVVQTAIVLAKLQSKSSPIFKKLDKTKVKDLTTYDFKAGQMKLLKEYGKEAQKELDGIVVPLKGVIKKAQALFQPFFDRIDAKEQLVKQEMLEYHEKAAEANVKLIGDFKSGKIKKIGTMLTKQAELKVTSENSSARQISSLVIKKAGLIPRSFLIPDTAKITKALKMGKKVPGCEMVTKTSIAI